MLLDFYDVGHGNCTVIHCPNGKRIMVDCGHNSECLWRPSQVFKGKDIDTFIISNFDEDHLSDFFNVIQDCKFKLFIVNNSIKAEHILRMKNGYPNIGLGVQTIMNLMNGFSPANNEDFGEVRVSSYWNEWKIDFTDTNNLSCVSFISYGNHKFIFPGDLEKEGWERLLMRQDFCEELKDVTVFVASHHGRESGCCSEVFEYCSPQIVLISDQNKEFATQETVSWYAKYAKGIKFNQQTRYVFTTRQDGNIHFSLQGEGSMWTQKQKISNQ